MTHPPYLRDKARAIRVEKRLTIDEIAERLALPRTTIYHWVKDIPIPRAQPGRPFPSEAQKRGTEAMQAKYRLLREAAYQQGLEEFGVLASDPTFRDFVCLYLAEGYKRCRNTVAIGNSDPTVLVVANRWLAQLSEHRRTYAIQYHADQDLAALVRFWGGRLDVDPAEIRLQRKSNSNHLSGRTWRSAHGVLTVRVSDTTLRARVQAWMDTLRATWV